LLGLIAADRDRIEPAIRILVDLLSDIVNAAALSGNSVHMLAKRLDRILSSARGEGRTVRDEFMVLADLYHAGLLTWLEEAFPDLTRNEIGLCGLIVLGMEPACIDRIFGYDHGQTFYNKRADIRRKLRLDRSVPLERYLNDTADRLRREHAMRIKQFNHRR
jgi:hypothetical protein